MLRALLAACLTSLVTLTACSAHPPEDPGAGGSGSGGSATTATSTSSGSTGTGGGSPWGTRTDIEAIFVKDCGQCHGGAWSSCWNVHESSSAIESAIANDIMPRGMTMAPADKAAVLAWLNEGAPCFGPEPDGGTSTGTGGPPPIGEGEGTP
jgi:hypothetical protein